MRSRILAGLAGATLLALAPSGPVMAQDQDRDRVRLHDQDLTRDQDRVRLQLRDQLSKDEGLTEPELASLDPELAGYAARNGNPRVLRETVREAVRAGCKGACLTEAVRAMNACMARGDSCPQARERVMSAVREEARRGAGPASDVEKGARVREHVLAQLTERDRTRERERLRDRDGDGDRDRERARERDRVRDPASHPVSPGR